MRTSFHHQPEAQHPKSSSYPQAGRPITPSFGAKRTLTEPRLQNRIYETRSKADPPLTYSAESEAPTADHSIASWARAYSAKPLVL